MPVPRQPTRQERADARWAQHEAGSGLRDRIIGLELTQRAVALQMGVHESQLTNWLSGVNAWNDGLDDFTATVNWAIDELEARK